MDNIQTFIKESDDFKSIINGLHEGLKEQPPRVCRVPRVLFLLLLWLMKRISLSFSLPITYIKPRK